MQIGIIGAGTWGMALARMLTNLGHGVTVWSALPEEIEKLSATRRQVNLPDMVIPDATGFTTEIGGSPIANGIDGSSVYPMQSIYSFGVNMNF